ncbi:FtsQ-type POTRA domain-containing protein, partial [Kineococcus sp. R8]|uniref:cell division protein FtsQ/DivIB n=1 Tax=Kineococcus siccus TaxID=2696567 RepID=UPI001413529C
PRTPGSRSPQPRDGGSRSAAQEGRRAAASRVAELAARRTARRSWRPGQRTVLALAGTVVLAVLAGWVLLASPWLRVEQVRVTGTERTDVAAVRALVDGQEGRPLAGVDVSSLAEEVSALPLVASTDVTRSWPSTLVVRVHERQAVAAVPVTSGGVDLVDDRGRVLVHAGSAPPGVPLVSVDVDAAGADALLAALSVNGALPAGLRARVAGITATSPQAVRLRLADGPEVVWGGVDRPQRKAEVLERLLADPEVAAAERVDVSAPDAAAVAS